MARDWEPGMGKQKRSRSSTTSAGDLAGGRRGHVGAAARADTQSVPTTDKQSAALAGEAATVLDELEQVCGVDDDGYVKITPGNAGATYYCTFHFRAGRYSGHYVLAVVHQGQLANGIAILSHKVARVRAGTLSPLVDRFRRGRTLE